MLSLKKCISIFMFAFGAISSVTAQYFEHRSSLYFEAGVGFYPYLTYGSAVDAALSSSSTSRFQLGLDAHLGLAINRRLYIVGGYDGILDEIFENGTYDNRIGSSLFSVGIRTYPLGAGLVLGADAGVSELDGFVAWGYGFGGMVAWDFSPIGLNFEVGVRTIYLSFEYSNPSYLFAVMPFVAMVLR